MWKYEYEVDTMTRMLMYWSEKRFSISCIHYVGEWICVVRIDNFDHRRRGGGTHIHRYGQDSVEYRKLSFEEAHDTVIRIARQIIGDLDGNNFG